MLDSLPQLRRAALLSLTVGLSWAAQAQSARPAPATPWADDAAARLTATSSEYASWLYNYRAVTLDVNSLRPVLAAAPMEGTAAAARGVAGAVLALPLPDGTTGRFRLVEAPIMAPALAAQFPMIKTYAGVGLDDPTASVRCDLTPLGFHAQILSSRMGTIYIDPVSITDASHYLSFYRHDMNRAARNGGQSCGFVPPVADPAMQARQAMVEADALLPTAQRSVQATGTTLRTYRLALAANREYVMARGGTVTSALASMNTSVNRVVGVYEKELAVRLILVPNTNLLITTVAGTYTNTNPNGIMLQQNQTRVDQIIGSANYDIGHVFSTGGGGIAGLGVVCQNGQKARGVTGSPSPTGDAFDIDYVAHEMGHQFGGNHPFNAETGSCGGGNRNALTSWEPGSGSTIMAYAGICGNADNTQNNSDAYFHTGNYQEIQAEISSTSCFVTASTGNTPPTVTAPASGRTIPKGTPFRLTAVGQDADGDALTYNWEEMDRGGSTGTSVLTATNQRANQTDPLFRSFFATASPTRYFPQLAKIISGTTPVKGEAYPTVSRQLKFRCTVRDEHVSAGLGFVVGGIDYTPTINITVASTAGPFVVQTPNGPTGPQWYVGSPATVTWAVANTNVAPVSCSNVDIILSRDGGLTYTDTLIANVPNNGSATFNIPSTLAPTTSARVMVHARDNFFFDISNANFSVLAPLTPDYAINIAPTLRTVCPGIDAGYAVDVASLAGFTDPVSLTLVGAPAGVTAAFSQSTVTPGTAAVALTLTTTSAVAPGSYPLTVTATAGTNVKTQNITLVVAPQVTAATTLVGPVDAATAQSLAPVFTWTPVANASSYTFELSDNPQFSGTLLASVPGLTSTTYNLTGITLASTTTYYWRVKAANDCGAGPVSTGFSFTTVGVACAITAAPNLPISISSSSVANAPISVAACDVVQDINVKNLRITYPNSGEIDIFLVSPSGRTSMLASGLCANGANINLNFDDQATIPYSSIPCPATTGGTYQSLGGLSRFIGEYAAGNWTLRIIDNTAARNGTLVSWTLEMCTSAVVPAVPTNVAAPVANDHQVQINWTDNACNESQQVIERSVGGNTNYQTLTTVAANVTTYTDLAVVPSTQYCYRVRAESATLQSANSTEICATTSPLGIGADALSGLLSIAPNPSAGEFTLRLTDAPAGAVRLSVVDAVGRVVEQTSLTASASTLTHTVDLRSKAEGVYTLRLTLADGRTAVRRLVKM